MSVAQLLMDLGDRYAEHLGDVGQVVHRFAGLENVVTGRNVAHRVESKTRHCVATMKPMQAHQVTADPLIGIVLDGRYRVEAMVATGGMSAVYRGVDVRLDRPVAIKVMESRYAGDQQFLTRFQREARAVARLNDPGLVAVYDQGLDGQHPFLVMELVEGGTLRELLRERGPMPPHAVAAVMRPVLSGLAVAHRNGLVHRDVKPENVLISDAGDVKIADFGLVRAVAEAKITSDSVILGTAAYLSPEQVSTGDAGPRSDVYAAGILIYELLTGITPFHGDTTLSVAYQRLDHDVARPSAVIGGVPPQFDNFVLRATERDPADRYADAQEMGHELDAVADELGLPDFRVPAPCNSAEHASAALHRSHLQAPQPTSPPVPRPGQQRHPTRQLTRGPQDWSQPDEQPRAAGQFAGIDLAEFSWERQRARRMVLFWLTAVLIVTGMVAAAAYTLGSNINGLL
ncbi:MAG: serine/threonine protein kinase [Mycobacterium sp.]|nr:serine/threonine protein kinase [Mycobacterium sp.]